VRLQSSNLHEQAVINSPPLENCHHTYKKGYQEEERKEKIEIKGH